MTDVTRTDVTIVGAGPVGLTLAILLASHGVGVLVLEAHPALSRHPKARGIAARSMETYRALGIEHDIRAAGLPDADVRFFRGDTLLADDFELTAPSAPVAGAHANTPSPGALCAQDRLEPVLLHAALDAGADVRFGARVGTVVQDDDGVTIGWTVDGVARSARSGYAVGCDGADSSVRALLGIPLRGEQGLGRFLSVRFDADLADAVRDRRAASYFLPRGRGGFLAVDNESEWVYQYPLDEETDAAALASDRTALVGLVVEAIGRPGIGVCIRHAMGWRMDAARAVRFRDRRVMLAGDAAHQIPPTGGHGMNLGIGDAEGLAWRIEALLRGRAGDGVLDDYANERIAVADAVTAISTGNSQGAYGIEDELLLGVTHGAADPMPASSYRPSGEVGRRLPHVALDGGVSTLDLLPRGFAIVTARPDPWWRSAADALDGVPVVALMDDGRGETAPGSVALRTGLGEGGALLVRPDGHIIVRAMDRAPGEVGIMRKAMRRAGGLV